MELILLIIYSVFVWFIFFKKKWLPWNITSQVIVVTIPLVALTILVLLMNIVAPSSSTRARRPCRITAWSGAAGTGRGR